MLEHVYDIAPGAGLAFATGDVGDAGFANNIQALAAAGATVIVDDLSAPSSTRSIQDGIIQSLGVDAVVAQAGQLPQSSAGNHSDSGYESEFRPMTANVAGIGSGDV